MKNSETQIYFFNQNRLHLQLIVHVSLEASVVSYSTVTITIVPLLLSRSDYILVTTEGHLISLISSKHVENYM